MKGAKGEEFANSCFFVLKKSFRESLIGKGVVFLRRPRVIRRIPP